MLASIRNKIRMLADVAVKLQHVVSIRNNKGCNTHLQPLLLWSFKDVILKMNYILLYT